MGSGKSLVEQRKLEARVRNLLGKGYSDFEICEKLSLRPDILTDYKNKIFRTDKAILNDLDNAAVYVDYLIKNKQLTKELDEVRLKAKNRNQLTALVAAVKQKREIYNDILRVGQELGFVQKKAAEVKVDAQMTVGEMTEEEVTKAINDEVDRMKRLTEGVTVEMREELLGVTGEEVRRFLPVNTVPEAIRNQKTIKKTRIKVSLKKSV